MKIYGLFISFAILLATLIGCSASPVVTKATGFAYEVVVTMKQSEWNSKAGEAIQDDLLSSIPGLPQAEPAFKVTFAPTDQFNGLLTYVRNILIVNIDNSLYTKVSVSYENNRWAQGQVVMTMNAPDQESIVEYMNNTNKNWISDFFTKIEMNRAANLISKNYSSIVMDNVKNRFDVMLNVPTDITYIRNEKDFFWASNNANTGRTDVIVYTFPYTDPNTFTAEYLINKRDSVLKVNLPG